jgi:hypothetical protein
MSTEPPVNFKAGGRTFVTDPTATAADAQATIRSARRDARPAQVILILGALVVLLALRGVIPGHARVYVGMFAAGAVWMAGAWLVDRRPRIVDGAQDLTTITSLHAGTRDTLRAMETAYDKLSAHVALYAAAAHANAAQACARAVREAHASHHHTDRDELRQEAVRRIVCARESLDQAYAACVGDAPMPWAQRVANRATTPPPRRRR